MISLPSHGNGKYSTFYLSSSNISTQRINLINLEVTDGPNSIVLNSTEVYTTDFVSPGSMVAFSLDFTTKVIITGLQLRGMLPSGFSQLTLYSISIKQR